MEYKRIKEKGSARQEWDPRYEKLKNTHTHTNESPDQMAEGLPG